ncbi:MAG: DUF4197 domain-containing protein, partial [Candidatus Methylomirabilales bacterium]
VGGRRAAALTVALTASLVACAPGQFDQIVRELGAPFGTPALTEERIASGLKEALRVGTENAVDLTGRVNGYFGNPKIKIPMPPALQRLADTLRAMGLARQVEEFVLSMNRAAEQAAPQATAIFLDAVAAMTFEDARRILEGQGDEATQYFRARTSTRLSGLFRPIVHGSMERVGVTRLYQDLTARYMALPLVRRPDLDLDHYVTVKSLDGLFLMVGEEERRIRTDPAARVTDVLREVFGR